MATPKTAAKPAAKPAAKAEEQKLTFATLESLKPADLAVHAKTIPALNAAIDKAREKFTGSLKLAAKIVAAMNRQYIARLNAQEIPAKTDFKSYFEANAGGKLPPRVQAVADLFNTLVLTKGRDGKPMLSEANFDAAPVDWLEKANAIISAAAKVHGENWKMCDDVLDTVNALSGKPLIPGDSLNTLKQIRERQKKAANPDAGETDTDEQTAVPLTVGRAVEFIKAAIENAAQLSPEDQRELFISTLEIADTWEKSYVSGDMLEKWSVQYAEAMQSKVAPHIQIVREPQAAAA